jgi:hypothetical protein
MKFFTSKSFTSFFFSILFSALSINSQAQKWSKPVNDTDNNFYAGLTLRNNFYSNTSGISYGIQIDAPLTKHWFVNYNLEFEGGKNFWYCTHTGAGLIGVQKVVSSGKRGPGGKLGMYMGIGLLLTAVIPEGVSYKLNPSERIVLMPYLRPFEVNRQTILSEGNLQVDKWHLALGIGFEAKANICWRLYCGTETGVTINYFNGQSFFSAGFVLGMRFRSN